MTNVTPTMSDPLRSQADPAKQWLKSAIFEVAKGLTRSASRITTKH